MKRSASCVWMLVVVALVAPITPGCGGGGGGGGGFTPAPVFWTLHGTGLVGGEVKHIAVHPAVPATVWATVVPRGIYRSTDSGATWTLMNSGPLGFFVVHPTDPLRLWALAGQTGIARSLDGGATWQAASGIDLTGGFPRTIAVDPATPTVLYAGHSSLGMYKSVDGGATWSLSNTGMATANTTGIAIHPTTSSVILAGSEGGGVFKSTDSGANWAASNTGLTDLLVECLTWERFGASPTDAYAGTLNTGVFKSTDSGGSWTAVNTGLPATPFGATMIESNPLAAGSLVVVVNGSAAYETTNGGTAWSPLAGPVPANGTVTFITRDPTNAARKYAGTLFCPGVHRDPGTGWVFASAGIDAPPIRRIAFDPSDPLKVYATFDDSSLYRSLDGGGAWSGPVTLAFGSPATSLIVDPATPATVYASTESGGAHKSVDSGVTWNPGNTGLTNTNVTAMVIDPATPAILYAATVGGGVFKTVNGAGSWAASNTGLGDLNVRSLAIDTATPTTLLAGTDAGLYRSTDSGGTWSIFAFGTPVIAVVLRPGTPSTMLVSLSQGGVHAVHLTVNAGVSWSLVMTPLNPVSVLKFDPLDTTRVYAIELDTLRKSKDAGATWGTANLVKELLFDVAFSPTTANTVFAGAKDGLYRTTTGGE